MDEGPITTETGTAEGRPPGFLRIETNLFDRIFVGVVVMVAIHLLWMRFLELYLPLSIATILSAILIVVIAREG